MSSSESGSESSSSAAEVSDTHKSGKREFRYPLPTGLSDSEDDAVSPSQHKLAMAKAIAAKSALPDSSSGGEEEEEQAFEEDLEESIEGQSIAPAAITSTDAMFSKFTEMSRHFAEMMEQHRKEQLMAKKTARSALSFDSPPPPPKSRKLPTRFTPERNAPEIIGATQADDDFERDSLASQSSRTTARVRLQEKFVIVETMFKDKSTPAEISERIRQIATDAMTKSGVYEDIDPEDKPFGGFKRNNVSRAFDFVSFRLLIQRHLCPFLFCSNIDPCPPRTRLSGMCIRVLIDTNVTAMLRCPSRPSRTRSKSPLLVSTIPPVTL